MQTITITGDNLNQQVLQAFKAMALAINPSYEVKYTESDKDFSGLDYEVTQADKADMQDILTQRECGELEYVTIDEMDAYMQNIISKRQNNGNKIRA
ncbi:hypothetical protein U5B43_08305 [Campylobacter sp. 9BO]|uniref:hypothetical protein n=1 Tax=Campylobacter sp. 9BO TaxID=3424759 RepID=UPI003D3288B2